MKDPTFWILARATGLTAYVLLTLSLLAVNTNHTILPWAFPFLHDTSCSGTFEPVCLHEARGKVYPVIPGLPIRAKSAPGMTTPLNSSAAPL